MREINNFICFDLEGPLSPQDNAYELMRLLPNGGRVFEVISRYDDLLALEGKEGYEPGDTLALILPFLMAHNISEKDIMDLAASATFTPGAEELVSWLLSKSWKVFCITTAYEPYALHLTHKLDIFAHRLASTPLPWDKLRRALGKGELDLIKQVEEEIVTMEPVTDDARIKQTLDGFFWGKLPTTGLGETIKEVKPVGGQRKVDALNRFSEKYGQPLANWVVVGDSITDSRMLKAVDGTGGLAVAFNANEYALPCATMSLAATSISPLGEILGAWQKSQRKGAEKIVRGKERSSGSDERGYFHWLTGREDLDEVIKIHKRLRRLVREGAGKLG